MGFSIGVYLDSPQGSIIDYNGKWNTFSTKRTILDLKISLDRVYKSLKLCLWNTLAQKETQERQNRTGKRSQNQINLLIYKHVLDNFKNSLFVGNFGILSVICCLWSVVCCLFLFSVVCSMQSVVCSLWSLARLQPIPAYVD